MFEWAGAQSLGRTSEITVMAPIRKGRVPGERWTYEENVRARLEQAANRVAQGIPVDLDTVPTIHFGRVTVLRPEHYLLYSEVKDVDYFEDMPGGSPGRRIPRPIDPYAASRPGGKQPVLTSFLLVQVAFHGGVEAYFRDIANFVVEFDTIFENCEEYPYARNFEQFWAWVRRYQIRPDLFYTRYPDTSAVRIRELERFKRRFDAFVATVRDPDGYRVRSLEDAFDRFLQENGPLTEGFPAPGGTYPGDEEEFRP